MVFKNLKSENIPVRPRLWVLYKALITTVFGALFFLNSKEVSLQVSVFYFIMESSNPKKYRKAVLIIPKEDSVDQRWIIKYYATDKNGNYKMFRENDCNSIPDLDSRKAYCLTRIEEINDALARGPIVVSEMPNRLVKTDISAKEMIEKVISERIGLRKHTIDNYNGYAKNLFSYFEFIGKSTISIHAVTNDLVLDFQRYLSNTRKLANRTVNNHIEHLRTVFKWIIKSRYIRSNPFLAVDMLPTDIGRNIAYNNDEVKKLLKFMEAKKPQFLFLCQFMYYTLMRSNEIANLKIGDIGKFHPDQIYIPASTSKNGKYRNVTIPTPLANIFKQLNIQSYPKDYFLFSKGLVPGASFYSAKDLADRYRENVLKPLGFTIEHTLYSWKHTGVVNLYMSGATKFAIQMQIGHVNTDSFDTYLKSLGLFENKEIMSHYPVLGSKPPTKATKRKPK
jgi:site-specific recombinase XerD